MSEQQPQTIEARTAISRDGIRIFKRYEGLGSCYYVRLQYQGKRKKVKLLETAEDSFAQARKIQRELHAGRFDILDQLKERETERVATIGEIFARYLAAGAVLDAAPKTRRYNINALRSIIDETKSNEEIDALSSVILTRDLVLACQNRMTAGITDHLLANSARISANSRVRMARSLFAKKVIASSIYQDLRLPYLSGFKGAKLLKVARQRYHKPDSNLITATWESSKALKKNDPSAYIAFLLAATAGLRKGEISLMRWNWIREDTRPEPLTAAAVKSFVLSVRTTSDFTAKGKDEREIELDPRVVAELEELRQTVGPDAYVIPGHKTERASLVFKRLSTWMRGIGWTTGKQAHELRKYFGAEVATSFGLYAAQKLLGHKQASTTNDYYADLVNQPKVRLFR